MRNPKARDNGADFESYVARLYEALGFRVDTNVSVAGQQVDILAETFIPGVGTARLLIECKWRDKKSITNQEVFEFLAMLKALRPKSQITRGVMVTNSGFSQDAMRVGLDNRENLELLTIIDLENQMFDLRRTLQTYVDTYESSQIFTSYVPLRATYHKAGHDKNARPSADIEATLISWIDSEEVDFVSVLADYGAGKTTLMLRLKYFFAKRFLVDGRAVKPLFVPLKKVHNYDGLESFLKAVIVMEFERDIPLAVFWRALKEGEFVIFLDGFDEAVTESDRENRRDSFLRLTPLVGQGSKVILTCRPSYFVSSKEHEELVATINSNEAPLGIVPDGTTHRFGDHGEMTRAMALKTSLLSRLGGYNPLVHMRSATSRVVKLELFEEKQIDIYLRRFDSEYRTRFKFSWQEIKNRLASIYDLQDLMSRPILLAMVNETVLSGGISINSDVSSFGPSTLYEVYTTFKLDTDWLKGQSRQLIPREHRAALAEAIAVGMFERGSLEIGYDDLLDLARRGFPFRDDVMNDLQGLSPAVVAADLQVCTFLTRSGEGVFRFSHRSFVEFFVARHLKRMALSGDKKALLVVGRYLPREILYFWGGFAMLEPRLRGRLLRWHSEGSVHGPQFSSNITGALLYSGPVQDVLFLSDSEVLRIEVRRVRFLSPSWSNLRFIDVVWRNVQFVQPELQCVAFKNVEMADILVEGGFLDLDFSDVSASGLSASGVDLKIRARSSRIEKGKFENSKVSVSGRLRMNRCSFSSSTIEMGSYLENVDFENCCFDKSIVKFPGTVSAERVTIKGGQFEQCAFLGMVIVEDLYDRLVMSDCRGFFFCDGPWGNIHFDSNCPAVADRRQPRVLLVKNNSWLEESVRKNLLALGDRTIGEGWSDRLAEYLG